MTRTTLEKTAEAGVLKVAFYQGLTKSSDHSVGVSKMIQAGHSPGSVGTNADADEFDVWFAKNVVELFEA